MARTAGEINYKRFSGMEDLVDRFLEIKGYKSITENNERVWKSGAGFLSAIKYIKIEFLENNTLQIHGWIRPMTGEEQDLGGIGIVGALPRKQVMSVINSIKTFVK